MSVLTADDLRAFDENGYVVVKNAVPSANLQAVIDALFAFLEMDAHNPDDWYRLPLTPGGMVEMYQHPAMWQNRQNERVHQAFAAVFGTEKLWVSIDRVNLKPPFRADHSEYDHHGFMHWDADVTRAATAPRRVQGVLCLTDTTPEMGGFRCAPGHHRVVREWASKNGIKPGSSAKPDMTDVPVVAIPADAGDLIIWDTMLYHGNGRNLSDKPRLAQYINQFPAPTGDEWKAQREDRILRWRERLAPEGHWVVGDKRGWEQTHQQTAELSLLGRQLLGLDPWDA